MFYCEQCKHSYQNLEDYDDEEQTQCKLCETNSHKELDIDEAVRNYKIDRGIQKTDKGQHDLINHTFTQIAGSYKLSPEWWCCTENTLDINFITSIHIPNKIIGVELVCSTGGPHVWLDSRDYKIYARHSQVLAERHIPMEVCHQIEEYYDEIYKYSTG